MTRERAKELLPIITEYADGKTVQWFWNGLGWRDADGASFDGEGVKWRIKPEPLECWVNVHRPGNIYAHRTKEEADKGESDSRVRCVRMREVEEDTP